MKQIIGIFILIFLQLSLSAQKKTEPQIDPSKKLMTVEASCGQCQFKMAGSGCTLAVRYNGKAYFVDKANIDSFGDAHSKMGFCNAIRKAKVQGGLFWDKKFKVKGQRWT